MYSNIRLLDSINRPKDIILTAAKKGLAGISLTDHEALCGHVDFIKEAKALKEKEKIPTDFKIGLGNEIYLVKSTTEIIRYFHFILIAKNEIGHQALKELSSLAWHKAQVVKGMVRVPTTYDDLAYIIKKYPNSLIATTACLGGELGYYTLSLVEAEKKRSRDEDLIYELKLHIVEFLDYMKSLFGEDFYVEIAPSNTTDQIAFNSRAIAIAKSRGIKVVIGTDAHYLTKEERPIHKAYLTSKNGEREVDDFYSSTYIMGDEDLSEFLLFTPELIAECSENSMEIYNKITEYSLTQEQDIPIEEVVQYPKRKDISVSQYPNISWYLESDNDQDRYWINTILNKAKEVGYFNEKGLSRIEKEADIQRFISDRLGQPLSAYHNTMQHYIDIFWECGSIVGPGRGSACGWLSNMLLGITQVDPLVWDLNEWRYLNKERAEIGDIDIDLAPSKRAQIFKRIREQKSRQYANVTDNSAQLLQDVGGLLQVCSFGTEGTRSAILTACRGYRSEEFPKGIDVDIAQYMTGMIPQERGFLWPMKDVIEGNEELDRKPITNFINEIQRYPGLLDIILKIEGLVNKRSQHASGVILYNKEFFKTNALMRSPNGDFTTQFDLHTSEYLGDIKFDFLSTEVSDKIIDTITLLQEANLIEPTLSIREVYNKYLHPNAINLKDQRIWDALAEGNVLDVFQFNSDVGLQAAKLIRPQNPIEMTSANALMRLMAEKGKERPLSRYVRMKQDPTLWQRELRDYGLGDETYMKILSPYYVPRYATPCMQEDMMLILMDKDISNFTLKEANDARKIVAKKQMKRIPELRDKFFKQCPNELLAHYIWETAVQPQLGYSFSVNHSLPYSFVGIQTLLLATNWPVIFWNCACLINNSGGSDGEEMSLEDQEALAAETCMIEMIEDSTPTEEEDDDDDEDDDEEEVEVVVQKKKKKKTKTTNYGKIATAIGTMRSAGVKIAPPDVNKSHMTFYPDPEQDIIRYGMRGINKIGTDVVSMILQNRSYSSIDDFLSKVKINKPQMVNLIKSGAFDSFGQDREAVMRKYIASISDQKKRLTLQNAQMLFSYNLIPEKYDLHKKIFNFNKFLKKNKDGVHYLLDDYAFHFYELHFDIDKLLITTDPETGLVKAKIQQTTWDAIYQKYMDDIRDYIKANHDQKLAELNSILLKEIWDKYCKGNISKWEMDSISFYYHAHELDVVDDSLYGFTDFYSLPEEPQIEKIINIKGSNVPLYRISRIAGTVLDKNKNKSTVTLLTKTGVVQVKVWQNQFSKYDRQISEKLPSGKKKVVEKSWFARGNKIAVVGIRRGDTFVPKRYASTPYEGLFNLITSIEDTGELRFRFDREEVDE